MIKMTADDDSYSLYDSVSVSVSATDLTVGTTNATTDTATDIDASSCDPNNAFYQQLRIGRAVLWYRAVVSPLALHCDFGFHSLFSVMLLSSTSFLRVRSSSSNKDSFCCSNSYIIIDDATTNITRF